eukprot:TRINITY_DN1365_c0_g1_i1.p1 TRINITY_DN1365_c0_g1~~TRINITY_DN1365_c0_g1_i1.p1  ORF type:complete len:628 (+),score=148.49 TRINITY_DN1365_c0_g1_i1:51-1934(+)
MLVPLLGIAVQAAAGRPHILFVVADDFGWNDIGYHQNKKSGANPDGKQTTTAAAGIMRTPTLDQLSAEGVRLESYYVQPLCSPTRATFMTGRYPFHTGLGPDVICIGCGHPYGLPARETLLPELLRRAGYATHAIGKWHLGSCDQRYLPTFRGFDSFLGYQEGAGDYYDHRGDMRNGTQPDVVPECTGAEYAHIYSTSLYTMEADRVVREHARTKPSTPMFMYLAFQSVHNPYEAPPPSIVDVNATYPEIEVYGRRVYAGMVQALDSAVANVTESFKSAGLWDNTLMVFTTDNGGIEWGNNYPLRGMKVHTWEGGIRGTAFVRGTASDLARVPAGVTVNQLMHSTDWLPTLCHVAGASTDGTLPLDGYNQWDVIAQGAATTRTMIIHNLPSRVEPTPIAGGGYDTSTCLDHVDPSLPVCHAFGLVGGALRSGDWKLVWSGTERGISSNAPAGTRQSPPQGWRPSGDVVPEPFNGSLFLFNITADPTESSNLAASRPEVLTSLLKIRDGLYDDEATVGDISWRFGFRDPTGHSEQCTGPLEGSSICAYGREFSCWVHRKGIPEQPFASPAAADADACATACVAAADCKYWTFNETAAAPCGLVKNATAGGAAVPCAGCTYGPRKCPGA